MAALLYAMVAVQFSTLAAAQNRTSTIVIEVCCSEQLKVDAPHDITIILQNPGGTGSTITVHVPKGTTAQGAANLVAAAVGAAFGVSPPPVTMNTSLHRGEGTAWDVNLTDGTPPPRKVKVEKHQKLGPQADDGHLKVFDNKGHKISNPSPGLLPALPYTAFYFKQWSWTGTNKTLVLNLSGWDTDGAPVSLSHTVTYVPGGAQPQNVFAGIGRFLQGLGMQVTYPSTLEMMATVLPSQLRVDEIEFSMFDMSPFALATYPVAPWEVEWEFDAYE